MGMRKRDPTALVAILGLVRRLLRVIEWCTTRSLLPYAPQPTVTTPP